MVVALIFAIVTFPTWPLGWHLLLDNHPINLGGSFWHSLKNSLEIAGYVAVLALVVGLPAGIVAALFEFPGRVFILITLTIPLLIPSFLWAIGWSALGGQMGSTATNLVNGKIGCCLVFLANAMPLVLWVTYAATKSLTGSQLDSARLAGGHRAILCGAGRFVFVPAVVAAVLAGVLTLSDAGPGQIFGQATAASEVLVSFASLYDYRLAAMQCVVLTLTVFVLIVPLVALTAGRLSWQILAIQVRPMCRARAGKLSIVIVMAFIIFSLVLVIAPFFGLLWPLHRGVDLSRAWSEVARTGWNTLAYAIGSSAIAIVLGMLTAICVGRSARLRAIVLAGCLILFALPPALASLGTVQATVSAPPWLDWLTRSRFVVCFEQGCRFYPIAALLVLQRWASLSGSWAQAAELHGVPSATYLWQVILPFMRPALVAAVLLIGLLSTADVGSILLLHPPGHGTLPLAIFTVMANAPEALVSSLCVVYVALAVGIVVLFLSIRKWICRE